jgi:hypothetical protein
LVIVEVTRLRVRARVVAVSVCPLLGEAVGRFTVTYWVVAVSLMFVTALITAQIKVELLPMFVPVSVGFPDEVTSGLVAVTVAAS